MLAMPGIAGTALEDLRVCRREEQFGTCLRRSIPLLHGVTSAASRPRQRHVCSVLANDVSSVSLRGCLPIPSATAMGAHLLGLIPSPAQTESLNWNFLPIFPFG